MGGLPVSRRIDIEEEQRWRQPGLLGIGLYTAEEAAKLLAVCPSTVRGGSSATPISSSTRLPDTSLQRSGLPKRPAELRVVTFLDVAELLVIKASAGTGSLSSRSRQVVQERQRALRKTWRP